MKKSSIFLIDGSSILYRSYYGIKPLHTSDGIPTQAVYGFCRSIKKLIDDFDPEYIVVVWDSKGKTFRSEIYEEYKATRQAPPSDLFSQKEHIIEFIDLIDLAQISKSGYEADDLIYSIANKQKDKNIVLVSPDKDLFQLISKNLMILDPMKNKIIDEKVFLDTYGFGPEKLAFFHSIVGDASDNIPGVRGIGKKGATELVQKFDSLDDLYKNIEKIEKERTKKLLLESKDNAFLSQKLFVLKKTAVPITLKQMKFDKEKWANANEFFERLEFSRLQTKPKQSQTSLRQTSLLKDSGERLTKKTQWQCVIVRTEEELQSLIDEIKKKKFFALDTETNGLRPLEDGLVGLSIACNAKKSYYVPLGHVENRQIDRDRTYNLLRPIFSSKAIKKTLHNAKFDTLVLFSQGLELNGIAFDTLLAANLLRKESDKIGLKKLSLKYLNEKMETFADTVGKTYKTFKEVPIPQAATYAAHDSLQTYKLTTLLKKELNKEKKLKKIFETLEMPLSNVLFAMERFGIMLDTRILDDLAKKVNRRLSTIEKKIFGFLEKSKMGETINLNSPKQIEVLLFDKLKLPVIKKSTKGKRSTDQEVLTELRKEHPIPGLILNYRELFKLKSTYIEALPKTINPETKRIHTSFSQTMVATGRLSSSRPNLQNIPASGDLGLKIREAFVAPRGHRFISADYSQMELRVLAHMTNDKNLVAAFSDSHDIHRQVAAQIFNLPMEKITHEQRQLGKRINFGIIYGMTPYGLSRDLSIKPKEAKEYIEKYFEQYPKVAEWIEKTVEKAKKTGFTETLMGRRRYVPGLKEKNKTLYEAARRIAINSPVQGTSAEIMKIAMINTHNALQKGGLEAKIALQIHDELLIESPHSEVEKTKKIVQKEMETVVKWKFPMKVAIRTGKNWAEITK